MLSLIILLVRFWLLFKYHRNLWCTTLLSHFAPVGMFAILFVLHFHDPFSYIYPSVCWPMKNVVDFLVTGKCYFNLIFLQFISHFIGGSFHVRKKGFCFGFFPDSFDLTFLVRILALCYFPNIRLEELSFSNGNFLFLSVGIC